MDASKYKLLRVGALAVALTAALAPAAFACPWCGSRFAGDGVDQPRPPKGVFRVTITEFATQSKSDQDLTGEVTLELPKKAGFQCIVAKPVRADNALKRRLECTRGDESMGTSVVCRAEKPSVLTLADLHGVAAYATAIDCG